MNVNVETKFSIGDKVFLLREELNEQVDGGFEFQITEHEITGVFVSIEKGNNTSIQYTTDVCDEDGFGFLFNEESTVEDCWRYGGIFETRNEASRVLTTINNSLNK